MDPAQPRRAKAYRDLAIGTLSLVAGAVITIWSYSSAGDGGRYTVAIGAVVVGAWEIVRGVLGLSAPAAETSSDGAWVPPGAAAPAKRWVPRSFRWFVAWRYLMAPYPRRLSDPIVGVALIFMLIGAFGASYGVWIPLAPPFVFGGPPIPAAFFFISAVVTALAVTFIVLAGLLAATAGRPRTLRVALWLALVNALAAAAAIGFYGLVRHAAEPEELLSRWMPVFYGTAGMCGLSFLLLVDFVPEFVVRVWGAVCAVLLGYLAWTGYGALAAEVLEASPLQEAALGSWVLAMLAGVGTLAAAIGLVFFVIRFRQRTRPVIPAAKAGFVDHAGGRRAGVESRAAYDAGPGRLEALALAGLAIVAVAVAFHMSMLIDELGEPTLRMLGIDANEEFRPLWVPGMQRAAIILGSIAVALAVIRYHFSFFTTVSIGGVMVGTMALIMVLSVMGGFENDLRQKILGSNAHILISKNEGDFVEYREIGRRVAKIDSVVAYSPFVTSEVVIAARQNYANVIIKGIDPMRVGKVTQLADDVEQDFERPLERLYPLAHDGGVLGAPIDGGVVAPAADAAPAGDAMDPAPDDLDIPDFDPVDLSGGWTSSAPDDAPDGPKELGAKNPDELDPEPDDMDIPDLDPPLDMSGGMEPADAGAGVVDAGPDDGVEGPGDSGIEGLDARVDEFVTAEELGLGDLPPLGVSPEIAELHGILVGRELVKQLSNYVGQEVTVVSPLGQDTPLGPAPRTKRYRVAGTFYTGMYEYDLKYVYVELTTLQDFLDIGDQVNGIEIRIVDPNRTEIVMDKLAAQLGPDYRIQDWRELNRSLFSALKLEKIAMFIVLAIIILVASFSIVGNLVMIVIEKAREIAVLKTLGATDRSVTDIFIGQGMVIGWIGMLAGVSLGLYHTLVTLRGFPLDPNVYYIDQLPISLEPLSVLYVAIASIVISSLATIYPAGLAASQRPVDGLARE